MQYKLTEEQSTEFFNNMVAIDDFAKNISTYSMKKVKEWYKLYLENIKWYQRTRSFDSFLRAIGTFDGLQVFHMQTMDYEILIPYKFAWCNGIKLKKLSKMTGLSITELEDDVAKVWTAARFMNAFSTFIYRNHSILGDVKEYSTIPYTVNDSTLKHLKGCAGIVKDYNIEV